MTSEIRINTIKNRVGLGTISLTSTGPIVSGIVTANSFSGVTGTFSGVINANNGINLTNADNKSILLGASDDMRIRHTGSHSEITDEGTGYLRLGSNRTVIGNATFSETQARFIQDGAVELYHDNIKRLETTSTGVTVTGNLTVTDDIYLSDANTAYFGTNNDMRIYHSGTHGYIKNTTNNLYFMTTNSKYGALMYANAGVELRYDNVKRFETTAQGINVIGHSELDNVNIAGVSTVTGQLRVSDGSTSLPSVAAASDTDSGLYFAGANSLGLVSGGSRKLLVNSSGVTINNGDLAVNGGNLDVTGDIRHIDNTNTKISFTSNQIDFQAAGASRFYINNYGLYVESGRALAFLATGGGATPHIKSGGTNNQDLLFTTGSGNPTRLRIASNGRLLYGNQINDRGAELQYEGDQHACIGIHRNTANHGAPAFVFSASRGTSAGSNTIVQNNDYLGLIRFAGTDGVNLAAGALITAIVDGTPGENDMPGRLGFWTTPDGSQTPVERLRITSAGKVSMTSSGGINPDPHTGLYLQTDGYDIASGNAIKDSTMGGMVISMNSNDDKSVGLWFATNGQHWSGISGQRSNSASTWGTDLRFYTHEDATNDLTYTRERLRIHSNGCVTKPTNAMFKAVRTSNQAVSSNGWHIIQFNSDTATGCFDIGNNFDTSSHRFTAPVTGYYQFGLNQRIDGGNGDYFRVALTVNGTGLGGSYPYGHAIYRDQDGFQYYTFSITSLIYLTAGQYVNAYAYSHSDTSWTLQDESQFYGYLVG